MAYIYDISKENAMNSRQILSAYFKIEGPKFKIIVKMATDTPNSFEVFEKDFSLEVEAILKEKIKKRKRKGSKILITSEETETETKQLARPIYYKFVEHLSNMEFDNSNKPIDLSEIL
jgi:hypothetical protein